MTDAQWRASDGPELMLMYLRGEASDRKLRLLACACVRRIWSLLTVPEWRLVVERAEAFADGLESRAKLKALADSAYAPFLRTVEWSTAQRIAAMVTGQVAGANAWAAAWNVVSDVRSFGMARSLPDWDGESVRQASILRHLFGSPFHPYPAPAYWPAAVVQLAEAVYQGADADFALHDALLEAGHPELAEHFRAEAVHPKGCWAVDVITGKK